MSGILTLCLLAVLLCACSASLNAAPTPTRASDVVSYSQPAAGNITANGVLAPVRRMELSFGVEGFVKSVEAEVGQSVQAGQIVAALDAVELERSVARAQLELEDAQIRLAQLQAQATPVPESVLAATTAITSAQAALIQARVQADQRGNQDIVDRAVLRDAEEALADAQSAYDKVYNDPLTRGWAPSSPAGKALTKMKDHYDVVLAQYRMHAASHSYEAAIASAEAQLAQARLQLYEAQHSVRPEAIQLAQLELKRAQQTLEAAQADLANASLSAPFDGVVSAVEIRAGEWAAPGAPAIELLDVSRWRIETKNVGELQIARVQAGQEVKVRVNAFRDKLLSGRVLAVSPVAVVQQGDTTYTLTIELEPTDLNLRPGMTAQVEIVVE